MASALHLRRGMTNHGMPHPELDSVKYRQRLRWGMGAFTAIAVFFLWEEHRAHFLGALPWILLLACLAVHFFVHGRHGNHHDGHSSKTNTDEQPKREHAGHDGR